MYSPKQHCQVTRFFKEILFFLLKLMFNVLRFVQEISHQTVGFHNPRDHNKLQNLHDSYVLN